MIYGFSITRRNGSRDFGVLVADSLADAARQAQGVASSGDRNIELFGDLEGLVQEQYEGLAFLSTGGC